MSPLSFCHSVTNVGCVQKTSCVMKEAIATHRGFRTLALGMWLASLTGVLLLPVEAKANASADKPGSSSGKALGHHRLCLQMTNCVPLITCIGKPHETYCIETTTCLTAPVKWTPLCTITVDAGGCCQMLDTGASNCPARFYRAVWRKSDSGIGSGGTPGQGGANAGGQPNGPKS